MTRRLRYQVAVSLDGFIADPNGGYDWIVSDPAVGFKALYAQFDTAVMGRKTFATATAQGGSGSIPGLQVIVFSRTLPAATCKGVTITSADLGVLDAGVVDSVEVALMLVLLGSGIPLMPAGVAAKLTLADTKVLPDSGIIVLAYSVIGSKAQPPRIQHAKAGRP